MTAAAVHALLPLLTLGLTAAVIMGGIALRRSHRVTALLAVLGLAGALLSVLAAAPGALATFGQPLLRVDGFALFYSGLIISSAIVVAVISYGYLKGRALPAEELYLLLVLATLGGCILSAAVHFASLFLGLELLTVSLYAMVAYQRDGERSVEAGVKYLVLASVSSAFLLFGMALLYAETGAMTFESLSMVLSSGAPKRPVFLAGVSLVMVGVGFKLALVPFHLWTPDIYEGAPAPVAAFVATASKGAVVALLLRFAALSGAVGQERFVLLVTVLSAASMVTGNLLALFQRNVKRILAYSSISHLGYVLVAFVTNGPRGVEAVAFYLTAYFVTMLGAFAVVTLLSDPRRDADLLEDYRGLGARRPVVAAVFTALLLSLAGIPLTAGFIGKFLILAAGVAASKWFLTLVLVLGSVISLFYYLRIIVAMYFEESKETTPAVSGTTSLFAGITLGALVLVLLCIGVQPAPLLGLIRASIGQGF